jgi:hypothetical protein
MSRLLKQTPYRTGHVFVGSFINAMVVTWIVVAGQATHFPY